MRRLLALAMLVLLPLLSSWSAASAYCADDSSGRAKHLGHHVDKHHGDAQPGSQDAQADADCDHCHSPGAALDGLGGRASPVAPRLAGRWVEVTLRAPPPSLPDRPNWSRFA